MPPRRSRIDSDEYLDQTFLNELCEPFSLRTVRENRLDNSYLDWLLQSELVTDAPELERRTIGMHLLYTKHGLLAAFAICLEQKVLLVCDILKSQTGRRSFRPTLQARLFSPVNGFRIAAFNGHELVLALHRDMNISCTGVLDLLSLNRRNRNVVQMVKSLANTGARLELFEDAILKAFHENQYDKSRDRTLAQLAWFAYYIASIPEVQESLSCIPLIDTSGFTQRELDTLAGSVQGYLVKDFAKPTMDTIDVSSAAVSFQGNTAKWEQAAYRQRLQNSRHQTVKATIRGSAGEATLTGVVWKTQGKEATIRVQDLDKFNIPNIQSVVIEGRSSATRAELQTMQAVLETLQQKTESFNDHWIKRIFSLPSNVEPSSAGGIEDAEAGRNCDDGLLHATPDTQEWGSNLDSWFSDNVVQEGADLTPWKDNLWVFTDNVKEAEPLPYSPGDALLEEPGPLLLQDTHNTCVTSRLAYTGRLNPSQVQAVYDMLDLDKDISIIQGPPGTGKTTVIAAYLAEVLVQSNKAYLVIAESNVAIKNVGEKLCACNIMDFMILVSSDFMIGWHEHLYGSISKSNIITSQEMRKPVSARIILCTLSMLSNARFNSITEHLYFMSVIVEEASQISINNYFSLFKKPFLRHLKKITFIGDDKQLPPFASDNISSSALENIFENKVLLSSIKVLLLNIQYRMPPIIGHFLSKEVYHNQLYMWKDHPCQSLLAVQFLNINGAEEPDKEKSFKNTLEAYTATCIARLLCYYQKSFKIITPYESQRDLLEKTLRQSNIPWENTCFTVDSFQGNESDYIIITIVRTKSMGFLFDTRRSNVMLSRARRGMYICSNRSFLQSAEAKKTLIGKLADEIAEVEGGWVEDIENMTEHLYIN